MKRWAQCAALAAAVLSTGAQSQEAATTLPITIMQPTLSNAGARQMAAAITQMAQERQDHVALAIVDAGGNLIYFERMDGAVLAATDIALAKAGTALDLTAPTKVFADMAQRDAGSVMGLLSGNYALLGGGRPITLDGHVVGAIAVSGAANGADDAYALAGLAAIDAD